MACLTLAGCNLANQSPSTDPETIQSQYKFYGAPAHGIYLCLSSDPGLPVYQGVGAGPVIGYTRNVIAFFGAQQGQWIRIVYYDGALGWIDGTKIQPYHGTNADSACTIPGVDIQQRPIFVIS